MLNMKEREFRESGSIANAKMCFEVLTTALRPRLHTEGIALMRPKRASHKGTSTEDLGNTTQGEHNSSLQQQPPLHKR